MSAPQPSGGTSLPPRTGPNHNGPSGGNHRSSVDSGWNRSETKKLPLPASLPSRPPVAVGGGASSKDRLSGSGSSWRDKARPRDSDRDRDHRDREYEYRDREYRDRRRDSDYEWSRSRDARPPPSDRYFSQRERSSSPSRGSHWTPRSRDRSPGGRSRDSSYRPIRDSSPHRSSRRTPPPPSSSCRPNRDREQSSYSFKNDREEDRDRNRHWEPSDLDESDHPHTFGSSSTERTPLRRDGLSHRTGASFDSRRDSSLALRDDYAAPSARAQEALETAAGSSVRRSPVDLSHEPTSASHLPTGPSAGIPTGPRGASSFSRGGPPRGRGGIRGGSTIPRGPSHSRGAPPGGPSGWMGRGRGGLIRGRGRGGMMGSTFDESPARSLARKVDAGGNAMTPDLLPVYASGDGSSGAAGGESSYEEGEREEGEMEASDHASSQEFSHRDDVPATEDAQTQDPWDSPSHEAMSVPQGYHQPARRNDELHLGSLPSRPSFSQLPHASAVQKSGSNTPQTPANPSGSIPASQNPYSSMSRAGVPSAISTSGTTPTGPASMTGRPSQAAMTPKAIITYSAHDFPRSVHPKWDAELWTLSAQRLASVAQLPLASNYNVSISHASAPPATSSTPSITTPGAPGSVANVSAPTAAANLRLALTELKEATLEMEMSGFRRDECERSRAKLIM